MVKVSIGHDKYITRIKAGKHEWIGDEPESEGGLDKGPSPFDLLLAALGTCSVTTVRMYADRKEWNLDSTTVDMSLTREKKPEGLVTTVSRQISFEGDLDEKQRARLLKIADACPVARIMEGTVQIETGEKTS